MCLTLSQSLSPSLYNLLFLHSFIGIHSFFSYFFLTYTSCNSLSCFDFKNFSFGTFLPFLCFFRHQLSFIRFSFLLSNTFRAAATSTLADFRYFNFIRARQIHAPRRLIPFTPNVRSAWFVGFIYHAAASGAGIKLTVRVVVTIVECIA